MAASRTAEVVAKRSELIEVYEHCPKRPYLELEIPSDANQVHVVEFTILSRDQGQQLPRDLNQLTSSGWASDPKAGSSTSFDAVVRRPTGRGQLRSRRICSNRAGHPSFEVYSHRWDCDPSKPRLKGWIEGIRAGDVLQLVPSATFRGWVNFVREATIRVEYQAVSNIGSRIAEPAPLCYSSLDYDRHEIRILEVDPGSTENLRGRFVHASLADKVDFVALSYCWTDAPSSAAFLLESSTGGNDTAVEIGQNVEVALRRLRKPDSTLRVWVDAVCINQSHMEERAQQVTMMEQIFSCAKEVHIWLGKNKSLAAMALQFIHDVYNYHHRLCPGDQRCHCAGTKHLVGIEKFVSTKNPSPYMIEEISHWYADRTSKSSVIEGVQPSLQFMNSLFELPWFGRVWVVQEVLLARRAVAHFGTESIPWLEIVTVNQWLNRHGGGYVLHSPLRISLPQIWFSSSNKPSDVARGMDLLRIEDSELPRHGILDVFLSAVELKATDPRDKLFAVLPFGNETSIGKGIPTLLQPDYEKSVKHVFADFVRWWIGHHQSLDILSAIHCSINRAWRQQAFISRAFEKPTWSFEVSARCNPAWARATLKTQFAFHTTRKSVPDRKLLQIDSDPLILQLKGYRVGKIMATGHPEAARVYPFKDSIPDDGIEAVFDKIFDPVDASKFWSGGMLPHGSRTIKGRSKQELQGSRDRYGTHLAAHWQYLKRPKLQALGVMPNGNPQWTAEDKIHCCLEKCFFVAEGGYHGLCPFTAVEGDLVALLHGAKVPYLLRPVQSTIVEKSVRYEFVGECFVEGIMYGELFQKYRRGDKAPQVFILM